MSDIDENDGEIFRNAIGKVRPIRDDRHPEVRPSPPHRSVSKNPPTNPQDDFLQNPPEATGVQPRDVLSFAQPGVSRQTLRRLRRGYYRIEAELDLHGFSLNEARQALPGFIQEQQKQGRGCVRIIHGKGWRSGNLGPVIKPAVDYWLPQLNEVLAFVSARPQDGGTGAVYVLLRTNLPVS